MTFEHRHENKSCSACRDRVNERVKVVKEAKVVKEKVFQNILGSQLLSDIQTFFYYLINSSFFSNGSLWPKQTFLLANIGPIGPLGEGYPRDHPDRVNLNNNPYNGRPRHWCRKI